MRCRGLQRLANPPYLGRFVISGLLSVALYCIPGGVRVVSIAPLYSLRQRLPRVDSTSFFARHPRQLSPCPPQPLASPSDATPASCRGSADGPGLGRILHGVVAVYGLEEIVRGVLGFGLARVMDLETPYPK